MAKLYSHGGNRTISTTQKDKNTATDLLGHPLVCYNDGGCYSKMSILRLAATHFPVLATLLRLVYSAVNSHQGKSVSSIVS